MDAEEARRRFGAARVGRLATVSADGTPHVVPFVFVLDGDTIWWAVDHKSKRSRELKRLDNIRANPRVEAVVDLIAGLRNELVRPVTTPGASGRGLPGPR